MKTRGIADMVLLDPEQVNKAQRRAEENLWNAENQTGGWEIDPEDPPADPEAAERERLTEIAEYREALKPVCVGRLRLPKLPLVRVKSAVIENDETHFGRYRDRHFVLLGEIMQMTGHVTIACARTGEIIPVIHDNDLELVPPSEC